MRKKVYTGKGIGVAVLDTGIFPHIDFGSRIRAFCDFTKGKTGPYDDNGHGTHVSGPGRGWSCVRWQIQRSCTWM